MSCTCITRRFRQEDEAVRAQEWDRTPSGGRRLHLTHVAPDVALQRNVAHSYRETREMRPQPASQPALTRVWGSPARPPRPRPPWPPAASPVPIGARARPRSTDRSALCSGASRRREYSPCSAQPEAPSTVLKLRPKSWMSSGIFDEVLLRTSHIDQSPPRVAIPWTRALTSLADLHAYGLSSMICCATDWSIPPARLRTPASVTSGLSPAAQSCPLEGPDRGRIRSSSHGLGRREPIPKAVRGYPCARPPSADGCGSSCSRSRIRCR